MWKNLTYIGNPQALIEQQIKNNPNAQQINAQINELIQANDGDAEKAFRNKCAEMDIDPEPFIAMMSKMCK